LKAIVYHGPRNIKVEEVPEPKPKRGEALVRFRAGSICGTDIHFYKGDWRNQDGRILGHDACGQAVETNERLLIVPNISCGHCRYCQLGRPNLCERGGFMGMDRDGFFSEFVAAPKRNLLPIPDNVKFEEAGVVEPIALALHTFDLIKPRVGEWATILGQGPIGLLMTQVAKMSGCQIIAVDLEDYRLKLSETYGADVCINPKNDKLIEKVKMLTQHGSNIVIEAAGRRQTVEQTPKLVRPAGRVALVGEFSGHIRFNIANEATFFSVYLNPLKYPLALDLLARRTLDVEDLITHRFPLTEFQKAITTALDAAQKSVKILLTSSI
jgi:threonine dehydrogenase-like Zn-dependent dehydrogenase